MVKKISENVWEIPKEGKMNVPGRVFASDVLMARIREDKTLEQVKNVAMLPGIVKYSIALPDAHQGYGACVGSVAAFDLKKGIISPGLTGYDINCGVRLLSSDLDKKDFLKKRKEITHQIVRDVPSGVGRAGEFKFNDKEINEILDKGVNYLFEKGLGKKEDIEKRDKT
jgi:tRNA-splicing ligase RtcB (3'-phosphate/5'-hydroxy nucleic acid ligase)